MADKISPVYDTLEAAPEGLRPFLVEANGKHVLNVDVDKHPDLAPLRNAFERQKGTAAELSAKLKPWDDLGLTPAQVLELKHKLETAPPKDDKELQSAIKQVRDQYEGKLATSAQQITEKDGMIDQLARHSAATQAIAAVGASVDLLLPHVLERTRTIIENGKPKAVVVNPDGTQRIRDALGTPMTLDDLIAEMGKIDKFAPAFPATIPGGSGSKNKTPTGTPGAVKLSRADARDSQKYQAAKEQAKKLGVELELID